jgi:hypothetical protein
MLSLVQKLMHSINLRVSTRDMERREITDDVGDWMSRREHLDLLGLAQ